MLCVPPPPEGVCEYNGNQYNAGDSFMNADGCNTCVCGENGIAACTMKLFWIACAFVYKKSAGTDEVIAEAMVINSQSVTDALRQRRYLREDIKYPNGIISRGFHNVISSPFGKSGREAVYWREWQRIRTRRVVH
ncbi:hypothetical protein DPMN_127356 [Dreissena polymorpha]|uniref:Pacifastin domain-containing protein n=1 Tax=Dreissena polymorpha TaxID=45954 RepID=A0A9D4H1V8_DREPO|nr:hypothetical protein DPMN_127356 [Dreissena polymorpha]